MVEAREVVVQHLFQAGMQIRVPIWQRRYSWTSDQWSELWSDIERTNEATDHFVGSVVVLQESSRRGSPNRVDRFLVVDGQQRRATLALLCAALRDQHRSLESSAADAQRTFDSYTYATLLNDRVDDDCKPKLIMQGEDNSDLVAIVDGNPDEARGPLGDGYQFFRDKVQDFSKAECEDCLARVNDKLGIVFISLSERDNAHRIFQTLNAGGKPLAQSDLVRNYFFLLLSATEGESFYNSAWEPMERRVETAGLGSYFSAWAVGRGHSGALGSLFTQFRQDMQDVETSSKDVLKYGKELSEASKVFEWISDPVKCRSKKIRRCLESLFLWGGKAAEALIFQVLLRFSDDELGENDAEASLELVLSFMARRFLAGYEPNLHRSIFNQITRDLQRSTDYLADLHHALSRGSERKVFPSDHQVLDGIESRQLYSGPRSRWVFSVLKAAHESSYARQKLAPSLALETHTIEHVLPQTLTDEWKVDLKEWGEAEPVGVRDSLTHTLGNLTLTPMNSDLAQRRFVEKRQMLNDHRTPINDSIVSASSWRSTDIKQRSNELARVLIDAYIGPIEIADDEREADVDDEFEDAE